MLILRVQKKISKSEEVKFEDHSESKTKFKNIKCFSWEIVVICAEDL